MTRYQQIGMTMLLGAIGSARVASAVSDAGIYGSMNSRPLVIELFTAQGCSSCPPAEAVLGALAARKDVLALAFHVDYWDSIGWKDRFALPASVVRQYQYVKVLGLNTAYTPQFVIDGREDLSKTGVSEIQRLLGVGRSNVPVTILNNVGSIKVSVGEAAGTGQCDVDLIAYQGEASTPVNRGENANRVLHEFDIVRSVRRLGEWRGAAVEWQVSLEELPAGADHLAVIVQHSGQGAIIGAAVMSVTAR